jgi:hypothetical protein
MPSKKRRTRTSRSRRPPSEPRFVGRDASPILDRYPPKDPELSPRGPPTTARVPPASGSRPEPTSSAPTGTAPDAPSVATPLIALERPFEVDEFSGLLGETSVRVTVPLEHLAEVLRRVTEFMGFGIYVYSVRVHPAPSELLKSFVVELQRVDYAPDAKAWVPFVEKGTSDSPFGPSGTRT